jgi:hypothetical protein
MLSSSGSVWHLIHRWLPVLHLIHAAVHPCRAELWGKHQEPSRQQNRGNKGLSDDLPSKKAAQQKLLERT